MYNISYQTNDKYFPDFLPAFENRISQYSIFLTEKILNTPQNIQHVPKWREYQDEKK